MSENERMRKIINKYVVHSVEIMILIIVNLLNNSR